jgi:hypothetical protein
MKPGWFTLPVFPDNDVPIKSWACPDEPAKMPGQVPHPGQCSSEQILITIIFSQVSMQLRDRPAF